ncbi:hypothetical protein AB5N19_04199 [Seiridium cardinale]
MSWASRRTTRKEDITYCLLGIFSVNMPMLYGEGMRAFTRLQEETMKNSNDLTLFIWQGYASSPDYLKAFSSSTKAVVFMLVADPYSPLAVVDTNGAASPAVSIHIAKHVNEHAVEKMRTIHRSAIHFQFHLGVFEKVATMPRDLWDAESNLFIPSGTPTTVAFHHFRAIQPFSGEFVVEFGTNAGEEHPWICIADNVSPLFSAAMAGDLRQVGEIGRRSDRTKIKIWALSLTSSHPSERVKVEIALRNSTLWKQPVYRADVVEASKFVAGCRIM